MVLISVKEQDYISDKFQKSEAKTIVDFPKDMNVEALVDDMVWTNKKYKEDSGYYGNVNSKRTRLYG